jgi:Gas vesicle synthesis protein GvpO
MTSNGTEKSAKRSSQRQSSNGRPAAAKARSRPYPAPLEVANQAAEQLLALTGREPEGVTGMERTDDGWAVQVEVLELRRVPTTTDMLAVYEVRTDRRGELQGYRRLRRYARGSSDDE